MQSRFKSKKKRILDSISVPDEEYTDLSPKGSIDEPIRPLIRDINSHEGLVTTSSCSGRISVFLEGRKKAMSDADDILESEEIRAGPGGKGGGGSWLFISHDPVDAPEATSDMHFMNLFGLQRSLPEIEEPPVHSRFIHLKFEPMILHILCSSLETAQQILTVAMGSGFRESGALSLLTASKSGETNPMVAVRSTGYSFDAIIGYQTETGDNISLVGEHHLRLLINIANERFKINTDRIQRFQSSLLESSQRNVVIKASGPGKSDWEDPDVRRERKRREGLLRQKALQAATKTTTTLTTTPDHENDQKETYEG